MVSGPLSYQDFRETGPWTAKQKYASARENHARAREYKISCD